MGKVFSDKVEQALSYIYYNERLQKGFEGRELLLQAVNEGDADAMCILARCCSGKHYVWEGHGFPEQEEEATMLLHQSVKNGSALGVLVALRSGELTPSLMKEMPFASLQEAADKVEAMAAKGDAFCQYTLANSYFWWDFLRIQNKGRDAFNSDQEFKAYMKENILKCEDLFWKAFRGGIFLAGNNLNKLYREGDDIIPPCPEKAKDIARIGAEYGYPGWQYSYAGQLANQEDYVSARHWYERAVEGGEMDACYWLGKFYQLGRGVTVDYEKAVSYFERCLDCEWGSMHPYAANYLCANYFEGDGVPRDYAKAYQLLTWGHQADPDNNFGVYYLAKCCFEGLGTQQDYALACKYLREVDWKNDEVEYMRGYLYCYGLGGVQQDIRKGVEHLQKSGTKQAREELLNYKKTLFGNWKRR